MLGASITKGAFRQGYALIGVIGGSAIAEKQDKSATVLGALPCNDRVPVEETGPVVATIGCRPLRITVTSAGKDAGNFAKFYINGKQLAGQTPSGRGLNVVAMDPVTWAVKWKRTYDVWEDWDLANEKVFDDLESLPTGTVVLVAAKDSGMEHIDTYTLDALQKCGASISGGEFRVGYALIGVKGGKAIAEKIGPRVEVSGELPCLSAMSAEAIANSPVAAKAIEETTSDQVLFVVVSDSMFYNTRIKWIMETWGQDVPDGALMVVADVKTNVHVPVRLVETDCARGSHDAGCCKYGHAVYAASERLAEEQSFEWFYFADDDVYVRPDAMKKQLAKRRITKWPIAKGLLGCANDVCDGICGGGGFLLNRKGLLKMVDGETRTSFVQKYMDSCTRCSHWGDLAVSMMIKDRKIKLENMKGLHPWRLDHPSFLAELKGVRPPFTLHYQAHQGNLHFLYKLFSPSPAADAARQSGPQYGLCAELEGRESCTGTNLANAPWN